MQELKNHILVFMPVLIELESMGINPIKTIYGDEPLTMDVIEKSYVTLQKTGEKYPKWKNAISHYISKLMERKERCTNAQ